MGNRYEEATKKAIRGDRAAFIELFDMSFRDMYYIALKYMKNENKAEGILHDSYKIAMENMQALGNPERFNVWLMQILANRAKAVFTAENPELFSRMREIRPQKNVISDDNEEPMANINYGMRENREFIRMMLEELGEEERLCLLMFYYENLSIAEIGETLCIPLEMVNNILDRSRNGLINAAAELTERGYSVKGIGVIAFLLLAIKKEKVSQEILEATDKARHKIGDSLFNQKVSVSAPSEDFGEPWADDEDEKTIKNPHWSEFYKDYKQGLKDSKESVADEGFSLSVEEDPVEFSIRDESTVRPAEDFSTARDYGQLKAARRFEAQRAFNENRTQNEFHTPSFNSAPGMGFSNGNEGGAPRNQGIYNGNEGGAPRNQGIYNGNKAGGPRVQEENNGRPPVRPDETSKKQGKKSTKIIIIVAIIVALLIGLGVAAFFVVKNVVKKSTVNTVVDAIEEILPVDIPDQVVEEIMTFDLPEGLIEDILPGNKDDKTDGEKEKATAATAELRDGLLQDEDYPKYVNLSKNEFENVLAVAGRMPEILDNNYLNENLAMILNTVVNNQASMGKSLSKTEPGRDEYTFKLDTLNRYFAAFSSFRFEKNYTSGNVYFSDEDTVSQYSGAPLEEDSTAQIISAEVNDGVMTVKYNYTLNRNGNGEDENKVFTAKLTKADNGFYRITEITE